MLPVMLDQAALRQLYAGGAITPADLVRAVHARIEACGDTAVFISRYPLESLERAAAELLVRAPSPNSLPLWGIPFAAKDNIDALGLPTTAGCPAFAYAPTTDATVIERLRAAGAILVGKTNLDQFATGLNGTRSPYGAPRCVFAADHVSGGSSSGSAVAVAAGLVSFALGTDTAGSGRVPAAFNNIVGIKPSPGRVSTSGVVPACRSIDVVTFFAPSVADGLAARRAGEGFDATDAFSRRPSETTLPSAGIRLGVLAEGEREFFGNAGFARLYDAAIERARAAGAMIATFDYRPFREAAALLYDGPWVAERLAAIESFLADHADQMEPTVHAIIAAAEVVSGVDAFRGQYALKAVERAVEPTWNAVDALLLPTSGDIATVAAMQADPIRRNARFGRYTNFANLMGCAAIAVPAGFDERGLPFGVMLVAPRDSDEALGHVAGLLHRAAGCGSGLDRDFTPSLVEPPAMADRLAIVVVGAHLSGMALNHQLTSVGGELVGRTRTAPCYRLYALAGTEPAKPGLLREPGLAGPGIEVETWLLAPDEFGRFVAAIPAPLGIGKIELADGSLLPGFLCEPAGLAGATDITGFGGWRAYLASRG